MYDFDDAVLDSNQVGDGKSIPWHSVMNRSLSLWQPDYVLLQESAHTSKKVLTHLNLRPQHYRIESFQERARCWFHAIGKTLAIDTIECLNEELTRIRRRNFLFGSEVKNLSLFLHRTQVH
jgi:hypothetical protein